MGFDVAGVKTSRVGISNGRPRMLTHGAESGVPSTSRPKRWRTRGPNSRRIFMVYVPQHEFNAPTHNANTQANRAPCRGRSDGIPLIDCLTGSILIPWVAPGDVRVDGSSITSLALSLQISILGPGSTHNCGSVLSAPESLS